MNIIVRKIFVLYSANTSNAFDTLNDNNWKIEKMTIAKIAKNSIEKVPVAVVIIKNQNDMPAETAIALNLGEENFILNWIYKSD